MLTLYFSPGACSTAAHIVLNEAQAPFEAKVVSLRKGQHKEPAYLAINARGKVPALAVDGAVITENVAILPFIADRFPEAGLLPGDSLQRAVAMSWIGWLTSSVHPAFSPLFGPQRFIDGEEHQAALVARARAIADERLSEIDRMLAGKDYALGAFSVVDAYLFPFFHWANAYLGFDMSRYPNYVAHHERMKARPAVKRTLEAEQAAQAALEQAA